MATLDPHRRKLLDALVAALLDCSKMQQREDREQVIELLPDRIRHGIDKHDDARSHVLAIVLRCDAYPEGVEALVEAVRPFDEGTKAWPAVLASAQALSEPALPPQPPDKAEAFALVIGISTYQHGVPPRQERREHEFNQLEFAAQDARAVHAFLSDQPGYLVEPLLVDEAATCRGVLRALDQLRRKCQPAAGRDPTVLVYFSGHGARDTDGRSFLVPHDARRDELFSTALWSRTFDAALGEIPTKHLVVMLDACHAADIGLAGAKDAEIGGFDPGTVIGAGTAERSRYVVASCLPGQRSYESDGHGVFTRQLLDLLSGRPFQTEEIELFQLYARLREAVREAARPHGSQEPYANFDGDTRIVVAINAPLRRQRLQLRTEYLAVIVRLLKENANVAGRHLALRLTNYVNKGERFANLEDLYLLFDGGWPRRNLMDAEALAQDCRDLIQVFEEADTSKSVARVTRVDATPTSAASVDTTATDSLVAAPPATGAPAAGLQDERRVFDGSLIDDVLARLEAELQFIEIASDLRARLAAPQGVRIAEVSRCLASFQAPAESSAAWNELRLDLVQRFRTGWARARVVRSNALDLRARNSP